MSGYLRHNKGEKLGLWELVEFLGRGGNAEVWSAINDDARIVALKILNARKADSEPYKRFKTEIDFLRSLKEQPGVLPIIDASIPDQPSRQNQAWLAMPIATSITRALGESPEIEPVVEAIACIAETLALLAAKRVAHRDIKPGNLYSFDGEWAIGDFGLVDYPDKEALTGDGKTLGPLYFMAPEMITDPRNADGYPADLYSLTKTFWVLATGQRFPPQGEQRTDIPELTLRYYLPHPRVRVLDRLIENATRYNPKDRPTINEFASELRTWLAPSVNSAAPDDLSDLAQRIGDILEPRTREKEARQEKIKLGNEALQVLLERMLPIAKAFADATHSGFALHTNNTVLDAFKFVRSMGSPRVLWNQGYCIVAQSEAVRPMYLYCGVGAEVLDDGRLHLIGAYITLMEGASRQVTWHEDYYVQVGSAGEEQVINNLLDGMTKNLRPAIEKYASMLRS